MEGKFSKEQIWGFVGAGIVTISIVSLSAYLSLQQNAESVEYQQTRPAVLTTREPTPTPTLEPSELPHPAFLDLKHKMCANEGSINMMGKVQVYGFNAPEVTLYVPHGSFAARVGLVNGKFLPQGIQTWTISLPPELTKGHGGETFHVGMVALDEHGNEAEATFRDLTIRGYQEPCFNYGTLLGH